MAFKRGKCGKGGERYKESGKCIIKSRIEFPDPMLISEKFGPEGGMVFRREKMRERGGKWYKER